MEGFVGTLIIFAVIGIVAFVLGISARTAVLFLGFIGLAMKGAATFDITQSYSWAFGLGALASYLIERYSEPEEEAGVIALKRFQKTLNIKVDGIFGDKTKKALEEWQVEKKLPVTSRFDKATRIAIAKSWEAEEEEEEKNK